MRQRFHIRGRGTRRSASRAASSTRASIRRDSASTRSQRPVRPVGRRAAGASRRSRSIPVVRRLALAGLLGLSLVLMTLGWRDRDVVQGPLIALQQALSPVEQVAVRAWQPIADAASWTAGLIGANSENRELRQRVDELEARTSILRSVEADNERLREMLALRERGRFPSGYSQLTSNVIARSPVDFDRALVIDRGSSDGVRVDDPVMSVRGLVGHVEAVSPTTARVELMVNRAEAVTASVVGAEATGVLRAIGNDGSPVLELSYVPQRASVAVGDIVETAGWTGTGISSIYPRGIPIGVVTSVGNDPANPYKSIEVSPFARFDRLEELLVLTGGPQLAAASLPHRDAMTGPPLTSIPPKAQRDQAAQRKRRSRKKRAQKAAAASAAATRGRST